MSTAAVVQVLDLMRAPYQEGGRWEGGRMPLGGIDCWGLVVEVRARAGLWTPDPWGNGPKPASEHPGGLPDAFTDHLVELVAPTPYCGVRMRSPWPGGHAGVYLPDGTVFHAPRRGPIREPLSRLRRRRRVLGFYNFAR